MDGLQAGIYRLYDETDGASFLGFSHNIRGSLKRLRFELTLNACPCRPLQEAWNLRGGLRSEVLEEFRPEGMSPEEAEAHLTARLLAWKRKLGPAARLLQTPAGV